MIKFTKHFTFDVILLFKQPRLSQVRQRTAVVLVPVNNDVTDNDVALSHQRRRMDSTSKYRKYREYRRYRRYRTMGVRYQKYRSDTTKCRYRTFAIIAILRDIDYRTSTNKHTHTHTHARTHARTPTHTRARKHTHVATMRQRNLHIFHMAL